MDAIQAILLRRSIRKYKDIPVEWDKVGKIVEAGMIAPTAGNVQDIKILVVLEEPQRKALAEACMQQYWMEKAPVHLVVVGELAKCKRFYGVRGERLYSIQHGGACVENILIAATALGLGSCWVGAFDEEMVKRVCGIPDYVRPQAVVAIGYADEVAPAPPRFKLENVVFIAGYYGRRKQHSHSLTMGEWSPIIEKGAKNIAASINKHGSKVVEKFKDKVDKMKKKVDEKFKK